MKAQFFLEAQDRIPAIVLLQTQYFPLDELASSDELPSC